MSVDWSRARFVKSQLLDSVLALLVSFVLSFFGEHIRPIQKMLATSLDLPPRVQSTVVIPSSKAEKKLRHAFEQLAGGDKRLGSSSLLSHGPVFQIEVVLLLYGSEQGANSHLFWRIAASLSDCWFVN